MKTHNIKNGLLLGAAVLTIAISSCESEDYFYENDEAPQFEWADHANEFNSAVLTDSVKILHQQSYEFRCHDTHVQKPVLTLTDTTGNFEYEFSSNVLKIKAASIGTVKGKFTATDIYGKSSELFFQLTAFYNTKPVAKGNARLIKNLNDCEMEIDLSQSYDSDVKHGGDIKQYEYKISSPSKVVYSLVTPLSKISYILKEKGVTTIEFRVCDNDGEWSEWETIYINV
jgi:hypothetical protein